MANDLIKIKDFPILDNYQDIDSEDRVVATHVNGSSRETVGITVGALGQKVASSSSGSIVIPRNLYGETDPTSDIGNDGDLYFKYLNPFYITGTYLKVSGDWISFQVTDSNWRRFMEGQGFDVVTYDATSIKAHAFDGNTEINNVIAPNVVNIYEYAFRGSSVKSLYLPKCKLIDDYAFKDCDSYTNGAHIDLPAIEEIGDYAFYGFGNTDHRATINISNVKTVGDHAFDVPYFWENKAEGVLDLSKCETIGIYSFGAFGSGFPHVQVQKVNLPAIKTIGSMAFRSIEGPNNFELHIGPNCTHIGDNILYMPLITNHKGSIYVEAIEPPTLDDGFSMLVGSPDWYPEHIYVPYQSVNAYKSATNWSMYASLIEAIPEEE